MNFQDVSKEMALRFTSWNDIPVERATIKRDEWLAVLNRKLDAGHMEMALRSIAMATEARALYEHPALHAVAVEGLKQTRPQAPGSCAAPLSDPTLGVDPCGRAGAEAAIAPLERRQYRRLTFNIHSESNAAAKSFETAVADAVSLLLKEHSSISYSVLFEFSGRGQA